jgi:hypothetical protein
LCLYDLSNFHGHTLCQHRPKTSHLWRLLNAGFEWRIRQEQKQDKRSHDDVKFTKSSTERTRGH